MQISFIIVTWNCLRQIQHCLESLQDLKIPDSEIIVIDAASTEDTLTSGTPYYFTLEFTSVANIKFVQFGVGNSYLRALSMQ